MGWAGATIVGALMPTLAVAAVAAAVRHGPQRNAALVQTCGTGMALVHVGKAGGSTISMLMRRKCHEWWARKYDRGHCPSENRTIPDETPLSKQVVAYWHVHEVPVQLYASFTIMVRNPIERIISIFLIEHPSPQIMPLKGKRRVHLSTHPQPLNAAATWATLFYGCFDLVNDLAEGLPSALPPFESGKRSQFNMNTSCAELGLKTLRGEYTRSSHFFWNYRAYAGRLLALNKELHQKANAGRANCSTKPIYVIRTEAIWQDLWKINTLLLGSAVAETTTKQLHLRNGSATSQLGQLGLYNRTVSRSGLDKLCLVLAPEIDIYTQLLRYAKNLEEGDREADYARLESLCPGSLGNPKGVFYPYQ